MTLQRLRASGGPEYLIESLVITDGVETFYFVMQNENLTLSGVEHAAIGMTLQDEDKNEDGAQELTFSIDNISGEVSKYLRDAVTAGRKITATRHRYTSDNLATPAESGTYIIKGGSWDMFQVDLVAGYYDMLTTRFPRRIFNLVDFPGLRYVQ